MQIDLDKLSEAIKNRGLSERSFFAAFGGKRRVQAWAKKCNPRYMRNVQRVLGVTIESLLTQSVSIGNGVTVEVKVDAPVIEVIEEVADIIEEVVSPKKSKSALGRMGNENLIVYAHSLDPDINLPDGATKKQLVKIIEAM